MRVAWLWPSACGCWERELRHGAYVDGAIPGFDNSVLSTQDGRQQLGVMINETVAPPAGYEAFLQVWMVIAVRLLEGGQGRRLDKRLPARHDPDWGAGHRTGAGPGAVRESGPTPRTGRSS
jgi:hypothetical protein